MVIKILFIILIVILIFSTWGFLTEWKFVSFTDKYTNPEDIKKEILFRAEKKSVDFPTKFYTVIKKNNDFIEIEIENKKVK